MYGVKLIVSDDHAGLKAARHATMQGVPWQRCWFHTSQNAMAHVLMVSMRVEVADDIRHIYNADNRAEADRRVKDKVARHHRTAPAQPARGEHPRRPPPSSPSRPAAESG